MALRRKILLVEGDADKQFYSACCRQAGLAETVWVAPPNEVDASRPGKMHAIALLSVLLPQLLDGTTERLAIIVDADYAKLHGLGFEETWKIITSKFAEFKYEIPDKPGAAPGGFIYKNADGLPPVSLWIMPNNHSSGFLEDFIKLSIKQTEAKFARSAFSTVDAIPDKRFAPLHTSKAEIATWLAWQKHPGKTLASAIGDQLLDLKANPCKSFIEWLKTAFA